MCFLLYTLCFGFLLRLKTTRVTNDRWLCHLWTLLKFWYGVRCLKPVPRYCAWRSLSHSTASISVNYLFITSEPLTLPFCVILHTDIVTSWKRASRIRVTSKCGALNLCGAFAFLVWQHSCRGCCTGNTGFGFVLLWECNSSKSHWLFNYWDLNFK